MKAEIPRIAQDLWRTSRKAALLTWGIFDALLRRQVESGSLLAAPWALGWAFCSFFAVWGEETAPRILCLTKYGVDSTLKAINPFYPSRQISIFINNLVFSHHSLGGLCGRCRHFGYDELAPRSLFGPLLNSSIKVTFFWWMITYWNLFWRCKNLSNPANSRWNFELLSGQLLGKTKTWGWRQRNR